MGKGIQLTIGPGEFIDRLTILRLKLRHAQEPGLQDALKLQLEEYGAKCADLPDHPDLADLEEALEAINSELWKAEDEIRQPLKGDDPQADFLAVARRIPRLNDERAVLKARIDRLFGWRTTETKCYGQE